MPLPTPHGFANHPRPEAITPAGGEERNLAGVIRSGMNIQSTKPEVVQYLRDCKPGVVVWVEVGPPTLMAEARGWGCINVARRWFDIDQFGMVVNDPEGAAVYCYDGIKERFGSAWGEVDYFVGFNEYVGNDKFVRQTTVALDANDQPVYEQFGDLYNRLGENAQVGDFPSVMGYENYLNDLRHNAFIAASVAIYEYQMFRLFSEQEPKGKYAAFSFPPGNPELWQWKMIFDSLKEKFNCTFPGHAMSAHSYWRTPAGPRSRDSYDPDAPYLVGREPWFSPRPMVPIIYTEAGFDDYGYGGQKDGFTHEYRMSDRDAVYAAHMKDFCVLNAELAEKYGMTFLGAGFFTTGFDPKWVQAGFDFTGIWQIRDFMRSWPKFHTVYYTEPTQPEEEVPMSFEFHGLFEVLAGHLGEKAGQPLCAIQYSGDGHEARQPTTTGEMIFRDDINVAIFVPASCRVDGNSGEIVDLASPF